MSPAIHQPTLLIFSQLLPNRGSFAGFATNSKMLGKLEHLQKLTVLESRTTMDGASPGYQDQQTTLVVLYELVS